MSPRVTAGRSRDREALVASRIAVMRKSLGLSYEQLAQRMRDHGVPAYASSIFKIEKVSRRIVLDEAVVLAEIFGVSLDDLVSPPGEFPEVTISISRTATVRPR